MMKDIHIMNQKKYMSPYFFLFSCIKPEIQNDLPKITQVK